MGVHYGFRPQGNNSYTPVDPFFRQTVMLLHGDGANGANNNVFVAGNQTSANLNLPGGFGASFDGTGDSLLTPNNSATAIIGGQLTSSSVFTIEAWIYLNSFTTNYNWIVSDSDINFSTVAWGFSVANTGYINFYRFTGSQNFTTTTTTLIQTNTWYHVALCVNGSTINMFVNGIKQTLSGSTTNTGTNQTTNALQIASGASGQSFNGYISNLRILRGTALYSDSFTPPTAPLTAITNTSLLTCYTSSIIDGSPNNFTITRNGDARAVGVDNFQVLTRNGNTTQGTFSPFSVADGQWSNYFDGGASYLSTPSTALFGSGDYTVEAWVYYNVVPTNFTAILNGLSTGSLSFYYDGGRFLTNFLVVSNRSVNQLTYSWTPAINTWYHLAVSRSGSTVRLFINGSQVASTTDSTNYSTAAVYNIGYDSGVASGGTNGYISNLRAVNGTALYTTNFTPLTAPLTAVTNTSLLTCQSNRFRDASTNNFTITRNSNVTVRPFSPFAPTAAYSAGTNGGSGYFDGNGDNLSIASATSINLSSGDFTIEAWVYWTGSNSGATICDKDGVFGSSYPSYQVSLNGSGYMRLTIGSGNGTSSIQTITSNTLMPINQWVHIAAVKNGTNLSLYQNGTSVASATQTATITDGGKALLIGYQAGQPTSTYWNGYISNLRIVKGTAQYTANFTPPTSPVTATANTSLLCNFTNAGIIDNTSDNVIETVGDAQVNTSVVRYGRGSIRFDGSGDYLNVPLTQDFYFGNGDFTVELWMNSPGINGQGILAFPHNASNLANILLYGSNSTLLTFWSSADGSSWNVSAGTTVGTISPNTWHHVAISKQGSSIRLFFDGTLTNTITFAGTFGGTYDRFWIGATAGNGAYNGYIDDLRITRGIARYTSNFNPNNLSGISFYTESPFFDR